MAGIPNPNAPTVNARGGGDSVYSNSASTTAARTDTVTLTQSGAATQIVKHYATLTLSSRLNVAIGSTINVAGVLPIGYQGEGKVVTNVSDVEPYSVSYEVPSTLGSQTQAGTAYVAGTYFDTGDYGTVGTSANLLTNNTKANVESFYQNSSESDSIETIKSKIFAGLNPDLPFVLAVLEAVGKALLRGGYEIVVGVIETTAQAAEAVGNVIQDIADWIGEAIDTAGKIVGNIAGAVVDAIGNTSRDLIDFLTHTFSSRGVRGGNVVTDRTVNELDEAASEVTGLTYLTNYSTQTLDSFWSTPRVLPAWLGGSSDDVAFGQSLIDNTETPPLNQLVLIPVTATQDRNYDSLKFGMLVPGGGPSMTYCWTALYDVDETTGTATKIIDLGNIKSSLTSNYNLQTIPLREAGSAETQPRSVRKGELFYIGIVQEGGTPCALHKWSATNNFTTGVYPKFIGSRLNNLVPNSGGTSVLPATFTQSEIISGSKYWGALGFATPAVTAPSMFYSDSFNRSTGLGASWTLRRGTVTINNSFFSPDGAVASYNGRLASTVQEVGVTVPTLVRAGREQNNNFSGLAVVGLRGDGSGKFVYLRVEYSRTGSSTSGTYLLRYSIHTTTSYAIGSSLNGGSQKQIRTVYSGSEFDAGDYFTVPSQWSLRVSSSSSNSTYKVYRNGTLMPVEWLDTGSVGFPYGTSNTEVLVGGKGTLYSWYAKDG